MSHTFDPFCVSTAPVASLSPASLSCCMFCLPRPPSTAPSLLALAPARPLHFSTRPPWTMLPPNKRKVFPYSMVSPCWISMIGQPSNILTGGASRKHGNAAAPHNRSRYDARAGHMNPVSQFCACEQRDILTRQTHHAVGLYPEHLYPEQYHFGELSCCLPRIISRKRPQGARITLAQSQRVVYYHSDKG
jgi:hypothetical protein